MLAIVILPITILILVAFALLLMWLVPKLKKSRGIDNLTDGLFNAPVKDTVDNVIEDIKDGKDKLVQKSKENAEKVKEFVKEQSKIDEGLKE